MYIVSDVGNNHIFTNMSQSIPKIKNKMNEYVDLIL